MALIRRVEVLLPKLILLSAACSIRNSAEQSGLLPGSKILLVFC